MIIEVISDQGEILLLAAGIVQIIIGDRHNELTQDL